MTPPPLSRAALIARAERLGLRTRVEPEGLLCWWPDEGPSAMFPLLWDCPYDGIVPWLEFYAPQLAARRGIVVPEYAEQLSFFGEVR